MDYLKMLVEYAEPIFFLFAVPALFVFMRVLLKQARESADPTVAWAGRGIDTDQVDELVRAAVDRSEHLALAWAKTRDDEKMPGEQKLQEALAFLEDELIDRNIPAIAAGRLERWIEVELGRRALPGIILGRERPTGVIKTEAFGKKPF